MHALLCVVSCFARQMHSAHPLNDLSPYIFRNQVVVHRVHSLNEATVGKIKRTNTWRTVVLAHNEEGVHTFLCDKNMVIGRCIWETGNVRSRCETLRVMLDWLDTYNATHSASLENVHDRALFAWVYESRFYHHPPTGCE